PRRIAAILAPALGAEALFDAGDLLLAVPDRHDLERFQVAHLVARDRIERELRGIVEVRSQVGVIHAPVAELREILRGRVVLTQMEELRERPLPATLTVKLRLPEVIERERRERGAQPEHGHHATAMSRPTTWRE